MEATLIIMLIFYQYPNGYLEFTGYPDGGSYGNYARKVMDFSDSDLYEDKSAILRGAKLGKEKYDFLLRELK